MIDKTSSKNSNKRILLVEDNYGVRDFIQAVTQTQGYTLLEAENPEAALRLVSQNPGAIDLLITDVILPGISGIDLAKHLKQTLPELKVLFISGFFPDELEDLEKLIAGAAFLQKPFTMANLISKIQELIDQ